MASARFTVRPHWFWRQFLPFRRMWCRAKNPDNPIGGGCRFRYGHPFPHEDYVGQSWALGAAEEQK